MGLFDSLFTRNNSIGKLDQSSMQSQEETVASKSSSELSANTDYTTEQLPPYLRYPNDPIAEKMFCGHMEEVRNEECGYRFMLYRDIAETIPVIDKLSPPFDINEIHYYCKEGSPAWYSISTMKDESVQTNSVRNWIDKTDGLFRRFGAMDQLLRVPKALRGKPCREVATVYLGQAATYDRLHGFDESHVYCRVFFMDEALYKKFILLAKKKDCSWRVEVNIPSDYERIIPPDFVPAGQTFGKFFPTV